MAVTRMLHLACILSVLFYKSVYADLFSAVSELESLLQTQHKVIGSLEDYIHKEKHRIKILDKHLALFKKDHEKATQDANHMENPMNSFTIINRLSTDLDFIEVIIKETPKYERNKALKYPGIEDVEGAAQGLLRLQEMYLLNVTELASGTLRGRFSQYNQEYTEYFTPMSASVCYELGRTLYESKNFTQALKWLTEAFHKHNNDELDIYQFTMVDIIEAISNTYIALEDYENALEFKNTLSDLRPKPRYQKLIVEFEKRLNKLQNKKSGKKEKKTPYKFLYNYDIFCRGEMDIPSEVKNRLTCWYIYGNHPFLRLAPIKVEQLYSDPEVLLFHEVMSDQEIEHFKNISKPVLTRAQLVKKGEIKVPATYRVTKTAWFDFSKNEVTSRLAQRMADFTGLEMEEQLQVANYGIGGHYAPHYDYLQNKTIAESRIATLLFYMSDVAQGGATVFPKLGLTVFPVRGTAVYWRNLLPSGKGHPGTLHAACPVLRGDKWVLNRWIITRGKELAIPCPIDYQENVTIIPPVKKTFNKL